MANLTRELRVVTEAVDLNPVPDRDLVVFKRVGGGLKLMGTASAGETFKRPLLTSASSYVAFAVSRDRGLRHRFTRKAPMSGQTRFFILHITLVYRVGDAPLVVSKLDSDPMRRIEEVAWSQLGAAARRLDWSLVHDDAEELAGLLLHGQTVGARGEELSNFERIRAFAEELGIELLDVGVERSLTEGDINVDVVVQRHEEERKIQRVVHDTALGSEQMAQEKAILVTQGRHAVRQLERLRETLDTLAKSGAQAFERAASKVDSFSGIQEAMRELVAIQSSFVALTHGADGETALPLLGNGPPPMRALASGTAGSPLARLLIEVFGTLGNLPCEAREKRQLLSNILHLLAELELGEEAQDEVVAVQASALHARFKKLAPVLDPSQIQLLQRLQDSESLRRELE